MKRLLIHDSFTFCIDISIGADLIEEHHDVCMGDSSHHVDCLWLFRLSCDLGYHELSWRRMFYSQEKG